VNIFELARSTIEDYSSFVTSFIQIKDNKINEFIEKELNEGLLWPEPLIQINPSFEPGAYIDELVRQGILHEECSRIFKIKKNSNDIHGDALRLHRHQLEAILAAKEGDNYVLTTGTGSGKSLSYIVPIVDFVLRSSPGRGIKAIVIYPMNALANSQFGELEKFLCFGYPDGRGPVTFNKYTGQETEEERKQIIANPPDILLTNYVMLELLLTRPQEKPLIESAKNLRFLVLDELHTYRGRQGADVAMLVRRVRDICGGEALQCVGTSATLASDGSYSEQQAEVANMASLLFGAEVKPERIIGETLVRITRDMLITDTGFISSLKKKVSNTEYNRSTEFADFINDPLAIWIESIFGVTKERKSGRLIRSEPKSINGPEGAAKELSQLIDEPEDKCIKAIQECLMSGYNCINPLTGFPVFAFKLHQFVSRGGSVFSTLEKEEDRYITVQRQQYVPNDRSRKLFPLAFCRECGQEYYSVRAKYIEDTDRRAFEPRELEDRFAESDEEVGFLYINNLNPWPDNEDEILQRIPDDFVNEQNMIKSTHRKHLPKKIYLNPNGEECETSDGIAFHYVQAPFRFCLHCGVAYRVRQSSDFAKLASLGSEGRSTATTLLCISIIRYLQKEGALPQKARKLLSFTDNRQDASLQAGHFNDFVEIGLLRSALYKAVKNAGPDGIKHEELTHRVFDALDLPIELYAIDPDVKYQALIDTKRSFRNVIGYRLYHDLRRGWRIMMPNLEQCGLLEIKYASLDEVSNDEEIWQNCHIALAEASPETRKKVCKVLLDLMRRELAIKVDYLDPDYQERIRQQSSQRLRDPWAIDEKERMEYASILYPRSKRQDDYQGNIFLSARGGFGQYLRRYSTLSEYSERITLEDTDTIIQQLLEALRIAGLVEIVDEAKDNDDVDGYKLPASAIIWCTGDGSQAFHDPIRVPNQSVDGSRTNQFFVNFYTSVAEETKLLKAHEHTAQVPYELRVEREENFREGRLPVLYCSPTMELGVDISQLNVVNMRNVPPTPANYAQRSGRAGRSGQPALVLTYCSTGSSHDQYFFKRPALMVQGSVSPPRLDLANEDLIRSHIHSIWLAETNLDLKKSLKDILDLTGEQPSLSLLDHVRDAVNDDRAKRRAAERAERILSSIVNELEASDWYSEGWIEEVMQQVSRSFDLACERWRGLYIAALRQRELQNKIIGDVTRSVQEKNEAKRLRREAEAQLDLLIQSDSVIHSDFYSYRYFASEGFLPGYNFPRLPLSAYIPAQRRVANRDEFLSRPRFLAISEFGPRSIIYHEGSRYAVNKVIMPVDVDNETISTTKAKLCPECGYLHTISNAVDPDNCDRCETPLNQPLTQLFRLQNVSTVRRTRINSDEEERLRLGYEIKTTLRFSERSGRSSYRTATIEKDGNVLATLIYGNAATIWRINLGWSRRKNKNVHGFILDTERGYWAARRELVEAGEDENDPLSAKTMRVIPYVEDRKNCLVVQPEEELSEVQLASLQAALKLAIQVVYQLEDNELSVEPLPDRSNRKLFFLYEAAEGGAGVLRRLIDDHKAMLNVARQALLLCHFDPDTGEDLRRGPKSKEDCEAACYDCMMNYSNQPDHPLLDRHTIRNTLLDFASSKIMISPVETSRVAHYEALKRQAGSELEKEWLRFIYENNYRLPSHAQKLISACSTCPDFYYEAYQAAIYIDGPHHSYPELRERDQIQTECLENNGHMVIRFGYRDNWQDVINNNPNIFGGQS